MQVYRNGEWEELRAEFATANERQRALACAKGKHQRGMIAGTRPWELASLDASKQPWTATYEDSREALRKRLATEFGKAQLVVIKHGEQAARMRALLEDRQTGAWIVV